MGKNVRDYAWQEIRSHPFDKNGNPTWALTKDGTIALSERFVEQGAIKRKSLKA